MKLGFKHQNKYDVNSNLYSLKTSIGVYFSVYGKTKTLGLNTFFERWAVLSLTQDQNIKYVHQLQNLYFALTGEELKPNDNESN